MENIYVTSHVFFLNRRGGFVTSCLNDLFIYESLFLFHLISTDNRINHFFYTTFFCLAHLEEQTSKPIPIKNSVKTQISSLQFEDFSSTN